VVYRTQSIILLPNEVASSKTIPFPVLLARQRSPNTWLFSHLLFAHPVEGFLFCPDRVGPSILFLHRRPLPPPQSRSVRGGGGCFVLIYVGVEVKVKPQKGATSHNAKARPAICDARKLRTKMCAALVVISFAKLALCVLKSRFSVQWDVRDFHLRSFFAPQMASDGRPGFCFVRSRPLLPFPVVFCLPVKVGYKSGVPDVNVCFYLAGCSNTRDLHSFSVLVNDHSSLLNRTGTKNWNEPLAIC
jgi:hypothetical protein